MTAPQASIDAASSQRMRNLGIVLVAGGFTVHFVVHAMFRARMRADATRLRANTWLHDPGAGAALAGEMLIWASKYTETGRHK